MRIITIILSLTILTLFNSAYADELKALPPYDWSRILNIRPTILPNEGNQILHFKHTNKPYQQNKEATEFVNRYMKSAKKLESDADTLRFASDAVKINGYYIELGSASGKTSNFLAGLNPTKIIHGFDNFSVGLPLKWDRPDLDFSVGMFAYKDRSFLPPPVLDNVLLYDGDFSETLPKFKQQILHNHPIALLHVDCDIYTSTKDGLNNLKENIIPGSIIVFDEFYNYPNSENHEWKAFQEFLKETGLKAEYLAFNANHEQVVVRITK